VDDVEGDVSDDVGIMDPISCRELLEQCSARMETTVNQPEGKSPKVTRK